MELTELIEKYLQGLLTENERNDFEKKLANDTVLRESVELQSAVMKGAERFGLKQQIQSVSKKYKMKKTLKNWGLGLGTIAVISLMTYYVLKTSSNKSNQQIKYELNENGEQVWSDADKLIQSQFFQIDPTKDTVIETEKGLMFSIPVQCFSDSLGNTINKPVTLEIKEAMDAASIIKAGLSSKSGAKLLESEGMFYINARDGQTSLKINPENGIFAQIPTENKKEGMMVFSGKRMNNGSIDWVAPEKMDNFLIPRDINSLNFYPPKYLDFLSRIGYNISDKRFTDSLYYSFAHLFSENNTELRDRQDTIKTENVSTNNFWSVNVSLIDKETNAGKDIISQPNEQRGINPAKIKAIWNEQFQNTNIATKEFESRLQLIHATCNESILNLYINNLEKDLCSIDSMAAVYDSRFYQFAALGDGRVKTDMKQLENLKAYVTMKTKIYTAAVAKTNNDFWKKQNELNDKANKKVNAHIMNEGKRVSDNFNKELEINLKEAYRQLGKTYVKTPPVRAYYGTRILTTGWKNVDAYVLESTANRTTLDYTDPNGKKAVIQYKPISVRIAETNNYDKVMVYLVTGSLNSFMRMIEKGNEFNEKLNELFTYNLVCVGFKENKQYLYIENNIKTGAYHNISLELIDDKALNEKLNGLSSLGKQSEIAEDLQYQKFMTNEEQRNKEIANRKLFSLRIQKIIFPCYAAQTSAPAASEGWDK